MPRLNDHGVTNRASVTRYIEEIGNTTGPALRVTVGTIHTATVPSFSLHVTTMNPNFPGCASLEDDIEWITMEDVTEPSNNPLNPPSTHAPDLPPQVSDDDEDEFDIDRDEGSRGLLSNTHGPSYSARYLEPVGRIWPQVKSIVIEVRLINCSERQDHLFLL